MIRYEGEKQALSFNAISFYGNFVLKVGFAALAAISAAVSVYVLTRPLAFPVSALSDLSHFLPSFVPPGLSGGFVWLVVHFSREESKAKQTALEIWDRQRAEDRYKKETKLAVLAAPVGPKTHTASIQQEYVPNQGALLTRGHRYEPIKETAASS